MADMTVHIPWAGDVSDYILLEYDAGGRSLRYRCVTPNEGTAAIEAHIRPYCDRERPGHNRTHPAGYGSFHIRLTLGDVV